MRNKTGTRCPLFYGWWIVLAGAVIVGLAAAAQSYISGQLMGLITDSDRNTDSALMTMAVFSGIGFFVLLAIGSLIDRFGPRRIMLICIPIVGSAILALAYAHSSLYPLLGLPSIVMSAAFFLPVQTATANWFARRRSTALAIVASVSILCATLTSLFGEQIENQFGQQGSFIGIGILIPIICLPLALFIRHRPEPHGSVPDGRLSEVAESGREAANNGLARETNFTLGQALKTRTFWMLTAAVALANGMSQIEPVLRQLFLSRQGFDYAAAVEIYKLAPLIGLIGLLFLGSLGDRFSKRCLLALAVAIQSISAVVLMLIRDVQQLYLFMLVFGFGSSLGPLVMAIRADYFGRKAFAAITVFMGFFSAVISGCFSLFLIPLLLAVRNSQLIMVTAIFVGFTAAVFFIFTKPPAPPVSVKVHAPDFTE